MKKLIGYLKVFQTDSLCHEIEVDQGFKKLYEAESLFPSGNSFTLVTNTLTLKYHYISPYIETCTGLSRERLIDEGVSYFVEHIHPDDIEPWVRSMKDLMDFCLNKTKISDRKLTFFQYNYRLKIENHYKNIIENVVPIALDKKGKPIVGLGRFQIMNTTAKLPNTASARSLNACNQLVTVFYKNYSAQNIYDELTLRELDIVKLLINRESSKTIAAKLFLSPHTVDTHRRNILRKLGLSSTAELVAKHELLHFL
ncbi:response regulator transcription factor [Aquimarina sp. AU58]|uniref:response regulator transcription factor n=1 Tax=Aquimarina sp. AU58 TaxID=1874112 RepID=UPI000D65350E|nr:helix-turn-helix transcriptional regulator [Aquimarina sp. AU58]